MIRIGGLIILGMGMVWGGSQQINRQQNIYPFPTELIPNPSLISDVSLLFLGSRRGASDIAYIQYLQAYSADVKQKFDMYAGRPILKLRESKSEINIGDFPLRLLRLDPYFHGALLEMASVLSFNLKKPQESLLLLKEAIHWNPRFYRYRLYAAAILYMRDKKEEKLIPLLHEAAQFSDCPFLLKKILFNLHIKYNNLELAQKILNLIDVNNISREDHRWVRHKQKELAK